MIRTPLACFLLVLALPWCPQPQRSAPSTPLKLKGLGELGVVVEDLDPDAQEAGLSAEDLKAQAIVTIKRDLPIMKIRDDALPYFYVNVMVMRHMAIAGNEIGYGASVNVEVVRPVVILDDSGTRELGPSLAAVWRDRSLHSGQRESIARQVNVALEKRLTKFAADYYEQNGRQRRPARSMLARVVRDSAHGSSRDAALPVSLDSATEQC